MSICAVSRKPNVETVEIVDKSNCGECGRWDGEAEKCREEQELVGGKN